MISWSLNAYLLQTFVDICLNIQCLFKGVGVTILYGIQVFNFSRFTGYFLILRTLTTCVGADPPDERQNLDRHSENLVPLFVS